MHFKRFFNIKLDIPNLFIIFNNNKAKKKLVSMQKTIEILQNELDHPDTAKKSPVFSKNVLKDTEEHIASLKPMIKYD